MIGSIDDARMARVTAVRSPWNWRTIALISAGVLAVWFLTLDMRHLLRSDEGRYAEIAREMFESGDWVTIRYNGLKYFEKPPLHLWMTSIAYSLFGVGDWQARLWVAISGMAGLLMTMLACRRWFGPRVALLSGLVLLATPTWNLAAHFNSLDMSGVRSAHGGARRDVDRTTSGYRHGFATSLDARGVGCDGRGDPDQGTDRHRVADSGLDRLQRRGARRFDLAAPVHPGGLSLFFVITAPWFVLVSMRNPEFPRFFFIHEHWQRYTSSVHGRSEPAWYFVPQLALGFLPWLGLCGGMWRAVRTEARQQLRPLLLLAVWAATIFVFFSASGSKLPGYIVPVFPALAIIAALALDRLDMPGWNRQLTVMLAIACVALLASPAVEFAGKHDGRQPEFRIYSLWLAAACFIAVAGLGSARLSTMHRPKIYSAVVASLSLFAATTLGLVGHESLGLSASGARLVAPMEAALTPDMPIYSVRMLDHTLPFYLRRTTIMVEMPDELAFGTEQEPQKWIPDIDSFMKRWAAGPRALAVMSHDTYDMLRARRLPMNVIAEDARRVVVSNVVSNVEPNDRSDKP